ncbi:Glucosyltransferase-S [Leuconostoc citreum LBAE C10]|uniref:KxYKxGKxW signal peptide domain-containing protein n=1 Tax=Leuconostoc citreum TaxID=33964 RepID=UPI000246696B|nr:papain-like cysteine protease family protein [Leuconostoc citreum]CCF25171.1 Glucosyltransferase-S [Leuconostoc citreum LBAE C10]
MTNYKLYKAGKVLVTGIVLTAGIILTSGLTDVNADTIENVGTQISTVSDNNSAKNDTNQPVTHVTSNKTSDNSAATGVNQPVTDNTSDKTSNNSATTGVNQPATDVTSDKASNNSAKSDTNQPVTHVTSDKVSNNSTTSNKNQPVTNDSVSNEKIPDTEPVKNGWVLNNGNNYYYENGNLVTGEKKIDNYWYNFDKSGQYSTGLTNLTYKTVFYDNNGHMYYGYLRTDNTYMYFDTRDGHAVTGERYYGNHQMEYYGQDFKQVRNNYVTTGNTYYFIGQFGDALTGFRYYGNQPNQVEYYGTNFKQLRNMSITLNGRNYSFGANGDLIIANQPTYFSQLDGRWSNHRFNDYTMGQAGCVPTSIAMVLNGSYSVRVSPDDVRNVMNNISVSSFGATGVDLINTVKYYGRQVEQINTVERTVQLLQQGVPVIFYVNVAGNIGHAIATYGYNNGATQVYDPYSKYYYNGWYNVNALSNNLSHDRNDWNAGRPVFAIM